MEAKLDTVLAALQEMQASKDNPLPLGDPRAPHNDIGYFGYTSLLVGLICMAVSTLYFYMAAMQRKPGQRKFEVLTMLITGIATVLYMTMFLGLHSEWLVHRHFPLKSGSSSSA